MKVVIAPDTFKECMPASKVAEAIARGVLEVCPQAVIDLCPMADGGGGTVEAMVAATGGRTLAADVFSPLGSLIRAHFGMLGCASRSLLPGELGLSAAITAAQGEGEIPEEGRTAVIEMAAASGLHLVPQERRDPMRTTTFGTGQLIMAALDAGAVKIIIGIGGSATVDGGCGCAQAIGVTFTDLAGQLLACGLAGSSLSQIGAIDLRGCDPRLAQAEICVACDVQNPLTGPTGAATIYGPQKGATPEMITQLDQGLHHLAQVIRRDLGIEIETLPGAGAAGGMGGGLVAFTRAKLQRGIQIVAQAVGLESRIAEADLVITGEGKLDGSSSFGKTAVGVARLSALAGVPVVCIPGQVAQDAPVELFTQIRPLVQDEITPALAMRKAEQLLTIRAAEAMRRL